MKIYRAWDDPEKEIIRLNELLDIILKKLQDKSIPYGVRNDEVTNLIKWNTNIGG